MKKIFLFLVLSVFTFSLFTVNLSLAAGNSTPSSGNQTQSSILKNVSDVTPSEIKMNNLDLRDFIAKLIKSSLSFLGILFLILVLYGGFLWMTSGGDSEKAKKGSRLITQAVIGLIIITLSYAVTVMVFKIIQDASKQDTAGTQLGN